MEDGWRMDRRHSHHRSGRNCIGPMAGVGFVTLCSASVQRRDTLYRHA